MNPAFDTYAKLVRHPLKFRLFLFLKLPAAWLAGVRVRSLTPESCTTSVPYKWLSRNPFRSTYFACLGMAAEMSTGALAMAHLYKRHPAVSMLVVKFEGEYYKKATGLTRFTCEAGKELQEAIEHTVSTGGPVAVRAKSTGTGPGGETIAEFFITWSFKVKQKS